MFESAEVGHTLSKEDYAKQEPLLREALLSVQHDVLAAKKFPVIIVIGGVDGAGKGETVNLFNEWMDPRHIDTHAFGPMSEEESQRPPMWRFWRALPPKGRIGVLFGSWYSDPISDRLHGVTKTSDLRQSIHEIRHFERMLATDGALILKFWFHISKKHQKQRLNELRAAPETRWRVTDAEWANYKLYDKNYRLSEYVLRETSTGEAPWMIIEGTDPHYRAIEAGTLLLEALKKRLANPTLVPAATPAPIKPPLDEHNVLNALDYSQRLEKSEYTKQLEKLQGTLSLLTRKKRFRKKSLIIVFEGQDAAGKGSAIRRITGALDARQYRVIPIAAPTEEERAQQYLWRFWRHLPLKGRVTIFDRSWYGRVLVERVENFCSESDWMRAYNEIVEFEEQLASNDVIVVKFWLAITMDQQLERFNQRKDTAFKQFKITDEDWRNRDKWPLYERAVCDMVERTSTQTAPWNIIPANDKQFARIQILKTLCERVEKALEE
ncbi:MAG: polyphosphate:AMP phosphotransferase [Planctomycetota bacterium]